MEKENFEFKNYFIPLNNWSCVTFCLCWRGRINMYTHQSSSSHGRYPLWLVVLWWWVCWYVVHSFTFCVIWKPHISMSNCNILHWPPMNSANVVDRYIRSLIKSTKWLSEICGCDIQVIKKCVGVIHVQWKTSIVLVKRCGHLSHVGVLRQHKVKNFGWSSVHTGCIILLAWDTLQSAVLVSDGSGRVCPGSGGSRFWPTFLSFRGPFPQTLTLFGGVGFIVWCLRYPTLVECQFGPRHF